MNLREAARTQLLVPAGIEQHDLDGLVGRLMGPDVDLGELFFQHQRHESWSLEDGIVKDGAFSVDKGVGVRAVAGEKTGFAYAEDIMLPSLTAATEAARSITRQGQSGQLPVSADRDLPRRYGAEDPIRSMDDEAKVAILSRVDVAARRQDPRVKEVNVRLSANHECVLVGSPHHST